MRYLARHTDYERKGPPRATNRNYNLRRMARLLEDLDHPERAFRCVHIAGTKGKGSVAIATEMILRARGKRTGLYTSPHLMSMLERIRVDGSPTGDREFVDAAERMRAAMERVRPTYFEIMTAAAFVVFAERKVDLAVIEVGLGGRLDATNLVTPEACAITRIEYDHTEVLGRTLGRIAGEKAGILKPGIPVVLAEQRPAARRVIVREARRVGAPVIPAPQVGQVRSRWSRRGFVLEFEMDGRRYTAPAAGAHQAENLAVALALARRVVSVTPEAAAEAFRRCAFPGRIELVRRRPDVVIDTAHNPASARALRGTLEVVAPGRPWILVFGTPRDKDAGGMFRHLLAGTRLLILTRARHPRAASPEDLAARAGSVPKLVVADVARAVRLACKAARRRDLVVVAGSFVVAGEARGSLLPQSPA